MHPKRYACGTTSPVGNLETPAARCIDECHRPASSGGRRRTRALELELLQVRFRGKTSGLVTRIDELFVDNNVELARLPWSNFDRPAAASLDPSLHTEGFGF